MKKDNINKRWYNLAFETIRVIVHEWDPYGLIKGGAPPDEFDREIASIVSQIPRMQSSNDAVEVVSRVFSSSFEPHLFRPEHCRQVGEKLHQALEAKGLLE
jgi:Domain of unknown function (DUF1871)